MCCIADYLYFNLKFMSDVHAEIQIFVSSKCEYVRNVYLKRHLLLPSNENLNLYRMLRLDNGR